MYLGLERQRALLLGHLHYLVPVMLNSLTDFNLALAKQNVVSSCNYSLMKDVTIEFQKELIGFRPTDVVYVYQMLKFQ